MTPQPAILAAASQHALFITLTIKPGQQAELLKQLARQQQILQTLRESDSSTALYCACGIGSEAWDQLWPKHRPAGLKKFTEMRSPDGKRFAPSTVADLFIHIHSDRADLNFLLGRRLLDGMAECVEVVEEIAGYRYLDSRDMIGFVDGTENPEGDERAEIALVGDEDVEFTGGAYVSIQRYIHQLRDWDRLDIQQQEAIVGRTRSDDKELDDETKPATAHIARVVIEEEGEELEILRHSMPWGTPSESGLYFVAYGRTPDNFDRMLVNMIGISEDGLHDHLLDHTRAVTGASFFVPSIAFLSA